MNLTNDEKIERINKWQTSNLVHPLTCPCCKGTDHTKLIPTKIRISSYESLDPELFLVCPKCDYIQKDIPETVYLIDVDAIQKSFRRIFSKLFM